MSGNFHFGRKIIFYELLIFMKKKLQAVLKQDNPLHLETENVGGNSIY